MNYSFDRDRYVEYHLQFDRISQTRKRNGLNTHSFNSQRLKILKQSSLTYRLIRLMITYYVIYIYRISSLMNEVYLI